MTTANTVEAVEDLAQRCPAGCPQAAWALGTGLARAWHGPLAADAGYGLACWAALLYLQLQQGRVALALDDPFRGLELNPFELPPLLPTPDWLQVITDDTAAPATGGGPLVRRSDNTLWWARYHAFDVRLRHRIEQRRRQPTINLCPDTVRSVLSRLFPPDDPAATAAHGQLWATAALVDQAFGLITGGPGTGKTTSLAALLLTYLAALPAAQRPTPATPILLLAPTGKAAQRLREGLRRAVGRLRVTLAGGATEWIERLDGLDPDHPACRVHNQTIHKALRPRRYRRPGKGPFHHDEHNPVTAAYVIVDEVSMVDLALMNRLVAAVPLHVPLCWLGDAEQLESVEAGSVLSDIVQVDHPVSAQRRQQVAQRSGLSADQAREHWPRVDHVHLTYNYRFRLDTQIGALAQAVQQGDADRFMNILQQEPGTDDVEWIPLPETGRRLPARARSAICAGYEELRRLSQQLPPPDTDELLRAFERFRILCATRHGVDGVAAWNRRVPRWLWGATVTAPVQAVLVTANDNVSGLYNGDTGLIWPAADDHLLFHTAGVAANWPAALLPEHEDGWAMTIHKSQGSEYDHVAIVLPRHGGERLCTRRLLYTAITRARQRVTLLATEKTLRQAVGGGQESVLG